MEIIADLENEKDLRHFMAHAMYIASSRPGWLFHLTTFEKDGSLGSRSLRITKSEFDLAEDHLLRLGEKTVQYGEALIAESRQNSQKNGGS